MRSNVKTYKTLTNEDIKKMNIEINRNYSYVIDNNEYDLKEKLLSTSNDKYFELIDDEYKWNPKQNSILMSLSIKMNNNYDVFGLNGCCYDDSVIGIGMSWKPDKSKIKKCIKIGEIKKEDKELNFELKNIKLDDVTSNLSFNLFFYISSPGKLNGHKYFGNEKGMILYEETSWTIIVEGKGSTFPIVEIDDPSAPLWSFKCDVTDICEDFFDEDNVTILLNKSHYLFDYIHPKSSLYNNLFYNEVISSALASVIIEIRKDQVNNIIDLDQKFERGSVLQALKYFHDKLDFDINGEYNDLFDSIKLFFDKEAN